MGNETNSGTNNELIAVSLRTPWVVYSSEKTITAAYALDEDQEIKVDYTCS